MASEPKPRPPERLSLTGSQTLNVDQDLTVTIGRSVRIEAADSLELVVGKARLLLKKDGSIVIQGGHIQIEASGTVEVKGGTDVKIRGAKITQN